MLAESFDPAKNERYLSPVGGGIDFGEKSRDAAIREVKEELGEEVDQLKLLGVIENLFMFNGQEGHSILKLNALFQCVGRGAVLVSILVRIYIQRIEKTQMA
ncbi:hypothetical protein GCM10026986_14470 [Nitrincola alkalisediminis]